MKFIEDVKKVHNQATQEEGGTMKETNKRRARREFPESFKLQVIEDAAKARATGQSLASVAKTHDIDYGLLKQWETKFSTGGVSRVVPLQVARQPEPEILDNGGPWILTWVEAVKPTKAETPKVVKAKKGKEGEKVEGEKVEGTEEGAEVVKDPGGAEYKKMLRTFDTQDEAVKAYLGLPDDSQRQLWATTPVEVAIRVMASR